MAACGGRSARDGGKERRHPGFPEDVFITSSPAHLYRLVLGRQSLKEAIDDGAIRVEGPPRLVRSLPRWLILRASGPAIAPPDRTQR
jgi:hypothetical protein